MKFRILLGFLCSAVFLTYCSASKKSGAVKTAVTYTAQIQPLMESKCAPCHFPEKKGRKTPLNTYDAVVDNIEEIVIRIQLHPGQRHFMPKDDDRLSEKEIQLVKDWEKGGFAK